jgi:hypothetical protein
MTDAETLTGRLKELEAACERQIVELQRQADALLENTRESAVRLIVVSGWQVCPGCCGYGARERLDAGFMRRFGLREWHGCAACGGSREVRGRGFVAKGGA